MDLNEIWKIALGELEITLSRANFVTWFRNTFVFDYKKGVFTIGVPSIFIEDRLKKKYIKEIQKSLQKQVDEPIIAIKFKVAAPKPEQLINIEKDKVINNHVDNHPQIADNPIAKTLPRNITLNNDYKFENFIVGASNQLAFAAANAVVKKPGEIYNPLFFYGDSGLGKTHLMQAIGHAYLEKNPDAQVLYVSTETFINEFIAAVSFGQGKAKDFKNRYRNVDLLLIDDIQFLSTKESTQDEFFHTFNHLYQNKKQVILTSDRSPKDIKGLEIRLKTRFEGGMVTDIGMPDLETREAILLQKAKKLGVEITQHNKEVITFIADNVKSSIRELEGALNKVIAVCQLTDSPMTIDKANEILGDISKEKKQIITSDLIIREVHKYYHIPIEEILGRKRTKELVIPRQITMYLLRHECNLSFPEIGREIGGKDHSTVMHGCDKIESCLSNNPKIKEDLANIKEKIFSMGN